MAENTKRTKDLTTTQEGIIAGLVLLFFGLLYWYLNPWKSEQKITLVATEQPASGTVERSSLASSTTAGATETTASTETTAPQAALASTETATTTPAVNANSTGQTVAAGTTAAVASTSTTTETAPTTSAPTKTTAANPPPPPPGPMEATQAEATASGTDSTTPAPSTAKAAGPAAITPAATSTEASAQTAAKPARATAANKLELAPGSPEAKLQAYLEKGTLETPVGMSDITFEPKTTQLTPASDAKVLLVAALLSQYPKANFLITAYTKETSTENKNSDELSLMRANVLGAELVKAGVDGKRITIMGMGKQPSPDKTSAASKKNQHIEISVIQ